jgi:Domain of unknown function (DUF2019)
MTRTSARLADKSNDELIAMLRDHALRRGRFVVEMKHQSANKEFDQMEAIVAELRRRDGSIEALRGLLTDPERWVRLKAAALLFADASTEAENVLLDLAKGTDDVSIEARMNVVARKGFGVKFD